MKLFNWMHRKPRQTPAHGIGQLWGGCFGEDECKRSEGYSNGRDDRSSSAVKPATVNIKPVQATLEQCVLDIQTNKARQKDLTDLLQDVQNRLLAIGTLGMSGLEDEEDMTDFKSFRNDSEATAMEVQALQKELEKVFYSKNEVDQSKVESKHAETFGAKNEKENPKPTEAQEYKDDTSGRKVQTGKTLFPLQEFLETPLEPATLVKKSKTCHSLGHLFSGKSIANQEKRIDGKGTNNPKRISISPLFLRALFKTKPAPQQGELHSKSKLQKFLHAFRKRDTARRSPDPGVIDEDDSCGSKSLVDLNYGVPARDAFGHHGEEVLDEFESFKFEDSGWLRSDDLWVLKNEQEYWIKTDDEYVVLEL